MNVKCDECELDLNYLVSLSFLKFLELESFEMYGRIEFYALNCMPHTPSSLVPSMAQASSS